ncbi:MAG: NifB/NifX family molybdenum-iron cluster-binding protein [Methanosarcinaceae archaeon]|nr:NifB/NifX family molybdenum-iron cluster-binding protein [Methanosarcinaceae archaeon]
MKVCIPSMGEGGLKDEVGQHFGRVPTYTIFDTETKEVKVIPNTSEHTGGVGLPPELLSKEGIDVMLCSGLGGRAVQLFEGFGISVFINAQGTVQDAISAWEAGELPEATISTSCQEHHH